MTQPSGANSARLYEIASKAAEVVVHGYVTGTSGNRYFVKIIGETTASTVAWPRLAGVSAIVSDEVLLLKESGGYTVIGVIER